MFFEFILICGLFIISIILILLLKKKEKALYQKLLIVLSASVFLFLLAFYAENKQVRWLFNVAFLCSNSIGYLLGPLIFFYTASLFGKQNFSSAKLIGHFSPFLFHFFIETVPTVLSQINYSFKFDYLDFLAHKAIHFTLLENVYFFIYVLLALQYFSRFQKQLKENYSEIEQKDHDWSKRMLQVILITLSIDILIAVFEIGFGELSWHTGNITIISIAIYFTYLAYFGINNSSILLPSHLTDILRQHSKNSQVTQNKLAHLSEAQKKEFEARITKVLTEKKAYLNNSLTVNDFSKMVSIKEKTLSAVINHQMNTTFFELINSYRIQTVKSKLNLEAYEHYTLLGIALDSGFKSKTSFYRIFKKQVGMTPSRYKKELITRKKNTNKP